MFRFIYVIFMNLFRAPYMITRMRYEADHVEKFTEEERYKLVRHVISLMKKSGRITTECYGEENLPGEGGYVMYPNHQGKYDALGIISTHQGTLFSCNGRKKVSYDPGKRICGSLPGKTYEKG